MGLRDKEERRGKEKDTDMYTKTGGYNKQDIIEKTKKDHMYHVHLLYMVHVHLLYMDIKRE